MSSFEKDSEDDDGDELFINDINPDFSMKEDDFRELVENFSCTSIITSILNGNW